MNSAPPLNEADGPSAGSSPTSTPHKLMRSLTIAIPALNEQENIEITAAELHALASAVLDDFEIILFNDGSTDSTGRIAEEFARTHSNVAVIQHPTPQGLGTIFRASVAQGRCGSVALIPGDHAYNTESLKPLFEAAGSYDVVIGCRTNQAGARSAGRAQLSGVYSSLLRLLFGFKLRDYHGPIVYNLEKLRGLDLQFIGYTFQIESIIKLLRRGASFIEVPVSLNQELSGHSRSLKWKTFLDLSRIFLHLMLTR